MTSLVVFHGDYLISVHPADKPQVFVTGFYAGESELSGGRGGHQVVQRPRRVAIAPWAGRDPFTLTLPIMLSNKAADGSLHSIESDETKLDLMSVGLDREHEPPRVNIRGLVRLPAHASPNWTLEDVQQDTDPSAVQRDKDYTVIRRRVVLVFQESPQADDLAKSTLAYRTDGRGHRIIQHYVVTADDVKAHRGLPAIAAKALGDSRRWVDIATLNHLSKSKQLKVGMKLRLP